MPPSNAAYQITEAHEDRIQRLEGSMEKVLVQGTTNALKMDNLAEKIEEGFNSIHSRLDKGDQRFDSHEAKLVDLKTADDARARRVGTIKRAVLPMIAASTAVIATKFGETIWETVKAWLSQ